MSKSYWNTYDKPVGGHPGIALNEYIVPADAYAVICDTRTFRCKDIPLSVFGKDAIASLAPRQTSPEEEDLLRTDQIVPLLRFLQEKRKAYFPPEGSPAWGYCRYRTLQFLRVNRDYFCIFDGCYLMNWRTLVKDRRFGQPDVIISQPHVDTVEERLLPGEGKKCDKGLLL